MDHPSDRDCVQMRISSATVRAREEDAPSSDVSGMQKLAKQIVSNITQSQIHAPRNIEAINSIVDLVICKIFI